jgi:autotransporter strand-loop-strand O-heptosyltransferase
MEEARPEGLPEARGGQAHSNTAGGNTPAENIGAGSIATASVSAAAEGSANGAVPAAPGPAPAAKPAFPPPAALPTRTGPLGIQFDFNSGCRVLLPKAEQAWRVRLSDIDTGNVLYQTEIEAGRVNSAKRYYVPVRIEIWRQEEKVFSHDYAAKDRDVLITFPQGTVGDTVGWFPYAVRFKERHGCRLTCAMASPLIPLFQDAYPDISFIEHDSVSPEEFYATYNLGLFFDDTACIRQPCDFRLVGLHRTAGYILGVDPREEPPRLAIPDDSRPIPGPYVCIATQSTTQAKYWNNPAGWREIIRFLKGAGYRVICVDQKPAHGLGLVWNHIPHGAEDQTGLSLPECARWLKHAEFFVGLSSGLSWLAWAAGVPVVMISGFTHPVTEFETPCRVINYHTCNSCWNDPALRFDHKDFLWCPRHKDTPRQFECTRLITPEQVKRVIEQVPSFSKHKSASSHTLQAIQD